jgi:hypothetical protein
VGGILHGAFVEHVDAIQDLKHTRLQLYGCENDSRANMGGVGACVKSTVYVVDKRNQRNFVGYVC